MMLVVVARLSFDVMCGWVVFYRNYWAERGFNLEEN